MTSGSSACLSRRGAVLFAAAAIVAAASACSGSPSEAVVECKQTSDCVLPDTAPAGCVEAECLTEGKCRFLARDADGDGHRAAVCAAVASPAPAIELGDDCDDADASRYPGNWDGPSGEGHPNACDGVDQDCSGTADDEHLSDGSSCVCRTGAIQACTGGACSGIQGCVQGAWGACSVPPNCQCTQDSVCPGQTPCGTLTCVNYQWVNACTAKTTWYRDADGDGYGNPASSPLVECTQPLGYVSNASDCDDARADRHPGAVDVCGDGVDNDCAGSCDDGCYLTVYEECLTTSDPAQQIYCMDNMLTPDPNEVPGRATWGPWLTYRDQQGVTNSWTLLRCYQSANGTHFVEDDPATCSANTGIVESQFGYTLASAGPNRTHASLCADFGWTSGGTAVVIEQLQNGYPCTGGAANFRPWQTFDAGYLPTTPCWGQ